MVVDYWLAGQTTPLHIAAKEGHQHIVTFLLERGADVTAKDYKNRNPLELAIIKDKK